MPEKLTGDARRTALQDLQGWAEVDDRDATLVDGEDTLVWEPNLTVAANEDHKGYLALLREFARLVQGEPHAAPLIDAGAHAMRVLEAMVQASEKILPCTQSA